ncbi:MAG: hypothetical protein ACTSQX_03125, partial [Candidatus Heimdallarchaeota archaeon]
AEKGNQTVLYFGERSTIFHEIDLAYNEQKLIIEKFKKNSLVPVHDLWLSVVSQMMSKLATQIENYNQEAVKILVVKLIAQLIGWTELLGKENLQEITVKHEFINNPTYNTILVKLMGDLSRAVLNNNNKVIHEKLKVYISFCNRWIDRLETPKIKILDQEDKSAAKAILGQWLDGETDAENLEELFSNINVD